jgi:hypothetical protein
MVAGGCGQHPPGSQTGSTQHLHLIVIPMPTIELSATEVTLGLSIDEETFRAMPQLDSTDADSIEVTIVSVGTKYTAQLDAKSLRLAKAAFQAATNPRISIFGKLEGKISNSRELSKRNKRECCGTWSSEFSIPNTARTDGKMGGKKDGRIG